MVYPRSRRRPITIELKSPQWRSYHRPLRDSV